jgi:competence protein ComEA
MDEASGKWASTNVTEPARPLPSVGLIEPQAGLRPVERAAVKPGSAIQAGSRSAGAQGADEPPTSFWLTHADQLVLALLSTIMLLLLAVYCARLSKWGASPIEIEHFDPQQLDFRIEVNSATWVEWGQLDGIGDALARRIVADREQNGPFRSIDDLRRVKGIGPKTLEKLRPHLTLDAPPIPDASAASSLRQEQK